MFGKLNIIICWVYIMYKVLEICIKVFKLFEVESKGLVFGIGV